MKKFCSKIVHHPCICREKLAGKKHVKKFMHRKVIGDNRENNELKIVNAQINKRTEGDGNE
jgi:hypothetical protein